MAEIEVRRVQLDHTHIKRFGGWWGYLKLYCKMAKQVWTLPCGKFKTYTLMTLCSPWILVIKPFGCVFKVRTKFLGPYEMINGVLVRCWVKKFKRFYFLGVPFFGVEMWTTAKDMEELVSR